MKIRYNRHPQGELVAQIFPTWGQPGFYVISPGGEFPARETGHHVGMSYDSATGL